MNANNISSKKFYEYILMNWRSKCITTPNIDRGFPFKKHLSIFSIYGSFYRKCTTKNSMALCSIMNYEKGKSIRFLINDMYYKKIIVWGAT